MSSIPDATSSSRKFKSDIKSSTAKNKKGKLVPVTEHDSISELMHQAFSYAIIANEEAVYLLELLDSVIYSLLERLNKYSCSVRNHYMTLVRRYGFHPVAARSSYSSQHPDSVLLASVFWADENWLEAVRTRVHLFRIHWMDFIHEVDNKCGKYIDLVGIDPEDQDSDFLTSIQDAQEIESWLCTDANTTYGLVMEVRLAVARIEKIVRKLTYPYLRKVVVHAKRYGLDSFKENYQNGSTGIRLALGRHDSGLGSFASSVDRWINNRIMTFIRANGMLVSIPDRAFTQFNIVNRHRSKNPNVSLETIASLEGLSQRALEESMRLVESQTGYVDLQTEDETTSKHSLDYVDRSTDPDSYSSAVSDMLSDCSSVLKPRDRILLSVLFGIDSLDAGITIPEREVKAEALRQMIYSHFKLSGLEPQQAETPYSTISTKHRTPSRVSG